MALGLLMLRPSKGDFLVARNRYGSGKEQEDRVISWAISKCVDPLDNLWQPTDQNGYTETTTPSNTLQPFVSCGTGCSEILKT